MNALYAVEDMLLHSIQSNNGLILFFQEHETHFNPAKCTLIRPGPHSFIAMCTGVGLALTYNRVSLFLRTVPDPLIDICSTAESRVVLPTNCPCHRNQKIAKNFPTKF